jgi:hypothetical protein
MNWKTTFFKPKWQSKDFATRLEAVTSEQHPDLINSLLEIAGNDEDARVRCAAIKRLHQLENILKLHPNESDPAAKKLLEERIRQLASSTNESRPPLEVRMKVAELTTNRELIEHLAARAPEVELRRAAIAKVERQGVLGDCCIQDADAGNRKFAASRISQHTTLKRVIDALRKSDKSLYTALQERLHNELLEQADPAAVQIEAVKVCTSLEHQVLEGEHRDTGEIEHMHASWQRIAGHAKDEMVQRYQRVCDRLAAPAPVIAEPPVKTQAKPVTEEIESPPTVTETPVFPHINEALSRLCEDIKVYETENAEHPNAGSLKKLKQRLEKTWAQCKPPHPEDQLGYTSSLARLEKLEAIVETNHKQSEKELGQAQEILTQLEDELEQGELHKALETRAKLQQLAKGHGQNKDWQKLNNKLHSMQTRLRELRDWQHWSNNKVRKRLIAEMEVLPAADLHPDALLDRIKSLQVEWKNLELSEQIPGDKKFSAAPWMWRKFSAAGHAAFDTAKPYLDKRTEIQSRHAQALATFCAELEQLVKAEPIDWTALSKGVARGRKKLSDLNTVPARQRQKLAKKLKATLDMANAAVQERYKLVELEKMKLIRAASQLIHMPERSDAIAQAKSLQSNWKDAGSLWRSKEQELWNQFRAHLDPLFSELKDQQASIRAADDDRLAAQKTLCTELRNILKSEDDLPGLHGKVQGLQDSWKDIEHPDRKLVQQFQTLVEEYEGRVDQAEQQQVQVNRERLWLKSALLHELTVSGRTAKGALSKKTETRVTGAWPKDSSDDDLERRMDQTCEEMLAGGSVTLSDDEIENMRTQARALCISLEFLAGITSPDEDREQRMKYQVDRLAQSMSGEIARQPAGEEALEGEKIWLGLYALPETDFGGFGKRIKHALSTILETT